MAYIEQEKLQRLISEVNILDVVNYLGIPFQKRGSNYFIHCPSPEHNDQHATNCYFKDGGMRVKCLACGYFASPIELVKDVAGVDFFEAADIVWRIAGCPSYFYEEDEKKRKKSFSISYREAKLLGIKLPNQIYLVEGEDAYKHKEKVTRTKSYDPNSSRYLFCKRQHVSWRDFLSERELAQLVYGKALEEKKRYQEMLSPLQTLSGKEEFPDAIPLKKAILDEINVLNKILVRSSQYA